MVSSCCRTALTAASRLATCWIRRSTFAVADCNSASRPWKIHALLIGPRRDRAARSSAAFAVACSFSVLRWRFASCCSMRSRSDASLTARRPRSPASCDSLSWRAAAGLSSRPRRSRVDALERFVRPASPEAPTPGIVLRLEGSTIARRRRARFGCGVGRACSQALAALRSRGRRRRVARDGRAPRSLERTVSASPSSPTIGRPLALFSRHLRPARRERIMIQPSAAGGRRRPPGGAGPRVVRATRSAPAVPERAGAPAIHPALEVPSAAVRDSPRMSSVSRSALRRAAVPGCRRPRS